MLQRLSRRAIFLPAGAAVVDCCRWLSTLENSPLKCTRSARSGNAAQLIAALIALFLVRFH